MWKINIRIYFRYFHEDVLAMFSKEFKGNEVAIFIKNTAPEGFGKIAEEFGQKIEEVDYNNKFEEMIAEIRLSGRIGKRSVEYLGEKMSSGEA